MGSSPKEKVLERERTLLFSLLLSLWAPVVTGIAMATSRSSTQLADFIRRTTELLALFVSWYVYRYVSRRELSPKLRLKYQQGAALGVAVALGCSGIAMLIVALIRLKSSYQPGGNVYLGLLVAILGALTNGWFWRRYATFNHEQGDKIIRAQGQLYRTKTLVDLCVMGALVSVALFPSSPVTGYLDLGGTFLVAIYLLWSSVQSAQSALKVSVALPPATE
jgi:divalent metal cation (Fe/Co/Zn/Cd) transporter